MATKIFVHGSGHKATSWEKTISYMTNNEDIVLSLIHISEPTRP